MEKKQTEPELPPVPQTPEIKPENPSPATIPARPEVQPGKDPIPDIHPTEVPKH